MTENDEGCTCPHYIVDRSDPEPYHPENVERGHDPACPVHGITALAGTDRALTRAVAGAMGWVVEIHDISDTFWRHNLGEMQMHCKYDALGRLTEGAVYSSIGCHTVWTDFKRSVAMLLGRDLLKVGD